MNNESNTTNLQQEGTPAKLTREEYEKRASDLAATLLDIPVEEFRRQWDELQALKPTYENTGRNYENPLAERETMPNEESGKTYEHENPLKADLEAPLYTDFLEDYKWYDVEISDNWLDPCEEYKPPQYTLNYNGTPFAPIGGIHGLTGQPGHGKTFTFTILIAAILKGEYCGLQYELVDTIPNPSVLYIDTEMEKGHTQLVQRRIYEIMGWKQQTKQERFKVLRLREEQTADGRWRKVLKAIHETQPTAVFLDGLLDVVNNFNDPPECNNIVYACMKVASQYNLSFWCLLHENPGSEKMVGHMGSYLERKATDVLKTEKLKEFRPIRYRVSHLKARGKPLEELEFCITGGANGYGLPERIEKPVTSSNQLPIDKVETYLKQISTFVHFPATAKDIKAAIRLKSEITDNNKLNAILQQAKNRRWLIEQEKTEWQPGQTAAKLKLNIDSTQTPLATPEAEAAAEEEAPF